MTNQPNRLNQPAANRPNQPVDRQQTVDPKQLLTLDLLSSLEDYTRAMFKAQYGKSFLVAPHHKLIIEALQDVVDGKCNRLIINIPPRYSKTELAVKGFVSWCFALNPRCRFLHLSYSDMLVQDNSDTIRSTMQLPLYRELFPNSNLEKERGSSKRWKTAQGGEFYAVSTQGQVTGFGAGDTSSSATRLTQSANFQAQTQRLDAASPFDDLALDDSALAMLEQMDYSNVFQGAIIIDDPVKPEDAESDLTRERINTRFENTIRSRTNSRNTPIIIIMQRLHEHDLCGYLLENEPEEWRVLCLPAIQTDPDTGERSALWPLKHTLPELDRLRERNPVVFDAQYMQDPTPKEGLMYSMGFRTYRPDMLPSVPRRCRLNVTDTADTGSDCLCSIDFIDTPEFAYVINIVFTDEPMEVTENLVTNMLDKDGIYISYIESNNGGRGFARTVKRKLRTERHNKRTTVRTFTQTGNKLTRIFTASAIAQNDILFPEGWERMWPKFYKALMSYRKNAKKSAHDDAPEGVTLVVELRDHKLAAQGIRVVNG